MAYIASSDVKSAMGVPATDTIDDAELSLLITRAQKYVDEYTGRAFECSSDDEATRYYSASRDVTRGTLWLDKDLNTVASITAGTDSISSSDYVTEPRTDKPYFALTLRAETSLTWDEPTSDGDYENAIQVNGQWAYSSTAPADIKFAMLRLVKFYYNQMRLSDETASRPIILESGATVLPGTIPADVLEILDRYRYRPVRA